MNDRIHPFAFVFFGSVVALVFSIFGFRFGGSSILVYSAFLSMTAVGIIAGLNWKVYPWQIGLVGLIPSLLFFLWRLFTSSDPTNIALNTSLFVFLPVISLVAGSFGAYAGRWISHRRKRKAASMEP